jgi:hypothetical protein
MNLVSKPVAFHSKDDTWLSSHGTKRHLKGIQVHSSIQPAVYRHDSHPFFEVSMPGKCDLTKASLSQESAQRTAVMRGLQPRD